MDLQSIYQQVGKFSRWGWIGEERILESLEKGCKQTGIVIVMMITITITISITIIIIIIKPTTKY